MESESLNEASSQPSTPMTRTNEYACVLYNLQYMVPLLCTEHSRDRQGLRNKLLPV